MNHPRHWSLGAKLVLLGTPFMLLALLSIALTLWVSSQLDGGSAAVNEAGRMRMQAYRMSLNLSAGKEAALPQLSEEFDASLELLRRGSVERPLFVPWDELAQQQLAVIESDWDRFRHRWVTSPKSSLTGLSDDTAAFTTDIDTLVAGIERHMSRWTTLLHLIQIAMMVFVVLGAAVLLYMGYLFVLEPVGRLKEATTRIQRGDLSTRVDGATSDEFDALAECFNGMAAHLQSMHSDLEAKVADKTSQLEEKSDRLQALYDVMILAARATNLQGLAQGFAERMRRIARADGVVLRWSDERNERFVLLASSGVPAAMAEGEQCLQANQCHCSAVEKLDAVRVIPIEQMRPPDIHYCANAGYATLVSVPIRLHERLLGAVDLFFHARIVLSAAERSLVEALTAHLASAMENLRLKALEQEAAVAQERTFIARELHDSIAQSLAFLKIQVKLMRDALAGRDDAGVARALGEIDAGVRESYGDVRELLVHFRTRAQDEDIGLALQTTLRKFEHQSGLKATLTIDGHGIPLSSDLQIQVLHIVQEALSNVRKHARATHVWLDVEAQPQWRFEVRDDGIGLVPKAEPGDETHLGLRIMAERAETIGATLDIVSTPGRGTSIILAFQPPGAALHPMPAVAEAVLAG